MMEVNLFGPAALAKAMLPHLRVSAKVHGRAHIIIIGSIGSLIGVPWEPWYHGSKFALLGLAESLQNETYNQGICVCVVCPGGIRTAFIAKLLNSKNPPFRRLVRVDAHIMAALQNVLSRRWLHSLLRQSFGG